MLALAEDDIDAFAWPGWQDRRIVALLLYMWMVGVWYSHSV
jgi:hypothetical protein